MVVWRDRIDGKKTLQLRIWHKTGQSAEGECKVCGIWEGVETVTDGSRGSMLKCSEIFFADWVQDREILETITFQVQGWRRYFLKAYVLGRVRKQNFHIMLVQYKWYNLFGGTLAVANKITNAHVLWPRILLQGIYSRDTGIYFVYWYIQGCSLYHFVVVKVCKQSEYPLTGGSLNKFHTMKYYTAIKMREFYVLHVFKDKLNGKSKVQNITFRMHMQLQKVRERRYVWVYSFKK